MATKGVPAEARAVASLGLLGCCGQFLWDQTASHPIQRWRLPRRLHSLRLIRLTYRTHQSAEAVVNVTSVSVFRDTHCRPLTGRWAYDTTDPHAIQLRLNGTVWVFARELLERSHPGGPAARRGDPSQRPTRLRESPGQLGHPSRSNALRLRPRSKVSPGKPPTRTLLAERMNCCGTPSDEHQRRERTTHYGSYRSARESNPPPSRYLPLRAQYRALTRLFSAVHPQQQRAMLPQ